MALSNFFYAELMALSNFFHETKADSAYDKGPVWYFDAYRLTNKGGTSYQHFSIRYIYLLEIESDKILSGT